MNKFEKEIERINGRDLVITGKVMFVVGFILSATFLGSLICKNWL